MAKSAGKTTQKMVKDAKSGKGTLLFTPSKKSPAKRPGVSGDKPKKGKSPFK